MFIKKAIAKLIWPNTYSNEAYIKYLKKNGVKIGKNTRFIAPKESHVDVNRAEYISIGDDCCLVFVTILAHDYSWYVFHKAYGDILPDSGGKVKIGNNCFIGYKACILKDTTIGDNVIIGAGSIVKGDVPSNTVWAGVPARQICTLNELYEKKKKARISDAFKRYQIIEKRVSEDSICYEMGMFSHLFLARTEDNYKRYISHIEFNGIKDDPSIKKWFMTSTPLFENWEMFIRTYDNQDSV